MIVRCGEHGWADVGQVRPCMNDTSIFVVDYDTNLYEVVSKPVKIEACSTYCPGGFATVDDAGRVYAAHYMILMLLCLFGKMAR